MSEEYKCQRCLQNVVIVNETACSHVVKVLIGILSLPPRDPRDTRRREETGFKRESSSKMATEWLEWEAQNHGICIRHQMNDTEKRIGERRLPVDGFHAPSQTVFQFHGCWWHGHDCYLTQGKEMNEKRQKAMAELLKETKDISKYIVEQGYQLYSTAISVH